MTIKEQMWEALREEGYDFMTAGRLVSEALTEFVESSDTERTFHFGQREWTLRKQTVLVPSQARHAPDCDHPTESCSCKVAG